jgi:hypothetical protein
MPNAIDTFRAQREAADGVYERLHEISGLLAQVRKEVDAVAGNADLRALLQREQNWLAQAERTVAEVRIWREREARQFWRGVVRRWALAGVFALLSAWAAGSGYAYVATRYDAESASLRTRAALADLVERRLSKMTNAERRQFDVLMRQSVPSKR